MNKKLFFAVVPVLFSLTITALTGLAAWIGALSALCTLVAVLGWRSSASVALENGERGPSTATTRVSRRHILRIASLLPVTYPLYALYERWRWTSFERTIVAGDNKPCRNAEVLAVPTATPLANAQTQMTDGSGHFRFGHLRREEYRFLVVQTGDAGLACLRFTRDLRERVEEPTVGGFPQAFGESALLEPIFFETGQAQLLEAKERRAAAAILRQIPSDSHVIIEGHTDDAGDWDQNLKLGGDRAAMVAKMVQLLAAPREITLVSYGNSRPADTGAQRENKKNRRVVVRILPKGDAYAATACPSPCPSTASELNHCVSGLRPATKSRGG